MNEIMNLGIENKDGVLVVSSRIIANGLGKEHRNVVRDLENILKTMAIKGMLNSEHTPTIIESTYINEQNYQEYKEYLLTKDGFLLYMFSIRGYEEFKLAYIREFDRMKEELEKTQIKQITEKESYLLNILKANSDLERAVAINEYEVGYVKPLEYKGEYVDSVLSSETLLTTTQIAKDFSLSAIKLNKILHEQGIQYKQSNQWLLYAKYLQEGLCQSNTYLCEDGEARFLTKWTQRGKMFIYNLLKEKYGLLPVSQWEK
jgi:phage regulatory protein, rha family